MTSHHTVDKQYLLPLAKSLVPANPDPGRLNHFLPVSKGGGHYLTVFKFSLTHSKSADQVQIPSEYGAKGSLSNVYHFYNQETFLANCLQKSLRDRPKPLKVHFTPHCPSFS